MNSNKISFASQFFIYEMAFAVLLMGCSPTGGSDPADTQASGGPTSPSTDTNLQTPGESTKTDYQQIGLWKAGGVTGYKPSTSPRISLYCGETTVEVSLTEENTKLIVHGTFNDCRRSDSYNTPIGTIVSRQELIIRNGQLFLPTIVNSVGTISSDEIMFYHCPSSGACQYMNFKNNKDGSYFYETHKSIWRGEDYHVTGTVTK